LSFAHSKHTPSMNCTTCHTVKAGAPRGRQVTSPVAAMHFAPRAAQSCASCHNNKRAFGGEDFADCRRCHKGGSFSF
jgi:c(7)-type cytochrome triheme protein